MSRKVGMTHQPHKRRWFQFRLRTLFILVVVLAMPLAWLGKKVRQGQKQAQAAQAIVKYDGTIKYDLVRYEIDANGVRHISFTGGYPLWLIRLLGYDFFATVTEVSFGLTDQQLTDRDVTILHELPGLLRLDLANTSITDAAMGHLQDLPKLKSLDLSYTSVTDAGLVHLARLTELSTIDLNETQTSEAGRQILRQALPNAVIRPDP